MTRFSRMLVGLTLAATSFCARAAGAQTEEHSHMHHPPPPPAPSRQAAALQPTHHHHGESAEHGEPMMMGALYGPYAMTREASGTAWQPDRARHQGIHAMSGAWTLMLHGMGD